MKPDRLPFAFLAILSLMAGIIAGLIRIGWPMKLFSAVPHHGALMVGGFMGTLIVLEKIIPLHKKALYVIPILSGTSFLAFFAGMPVVGFALLIGASLGLLVVFVYYLMKDRSLVHLLMMAGATAWLTGNVLLAVTNFYPVAFPWWLGFGLFVITSERMELMKFLPVTERQKLTVVALLFLYLIACIVSFHGPGKMIAGVSIAGVAIWLMRYDMVSLSIRKTGLTRYVGISLLSGYFFLLLTALFMLITTAQAFAYDLIVHTFFIGFIMAMIFAHGPIILPGVIGSSIKPYSRLLYAWLTLLHTSLVLRIVGDLGLSVDLRMLSGMITTTAILGYFITIGTLVFLQLRKNAKAV